jgi:hypothetical protein
VYAAAGFVGRRQGSNLLALTSFVCQLLEGSMALGLIFVATVCWLQVGSM